MRKLATAAVVAGLFLGGAGAAVADSWHAIPMVKSDGVRLSGAYLWEPRGQNHGGFHFKVTLEDALAGDGHNVYVQAKVEGYGWNRFYGVQKKNVQIDKIVYDGAAQTTGEAWIRACRDRGSLRPDNCTVTKEYRRQR